MEGERPPVTLPEGCLVGKYARSVAYYVAGWTVRSLSVALTIAKDKRAVYQTFAEQHTIREKEVKDQDVSVSLVLK